MPVIRAWPPRVGRGMILFHPMPHKTELRVLLLEPWLGGSHLAFTTAFKKHSQHDVRVIGLKPRHWKWRQQASAWELARRIAQNESDRDWVPDVLLVSDYVDLPRLIGFLPPAWRALPTACYFHENQLTYRGAHAPDHTHGFTNILTAIRADALVFNSEFHRRSFGEAATQLLGKLPKPTPRAELKAAIGTSVVVPPLPELEEVPLGPGPGPGAPLRVAFPHRLEFDKRPIEFLDSVEAAASSGGCEIEIVMLGGDPAKADDETRRAIESASRRIAHVGYVETRRDYAHLLGSCDIVASSAIHDFFGLAIVEAMAAGCVPVVPDRLAYPETVGDACAPITGAGLVHDIGDAMSALAQAPETVRHSSTRAAMRAQALRFDARRDRSASALDRILERVARPE